MAKSDEERKLEAEATKILRRAGFTWGGQPRNTDSGNQFAFEKRMLRCPYRGASRGGNKAA